MLPPREPELKLPLLLGALVLLLVVLAGLVVVLLLFLCGLTYSELDRD